MKSSYRQKNIWRVMVIVLLFALTIPFMKTYPVKAKPASKAETEQRSDIINIAPAHNNMLVAEIENDSIVTYSLDVSISSLILIRPK